MRLNKIAIVYDWLDKWGGVERILLTLHEIFPRADFYSSCFDEKGAVWAKKMTIKTSFLQRLPKLINKNRVASFIFYPYAFESFDFSGYDLVISVTSSFAKGIITKPETKHICCLLTPTRYLWLYPELYLKKNILMKLLLHYINIMKRWDYVAAQRPDKIISISQTVADRCRRYYQRESEVVYPPFDIKYWKQVRRSKFNGFDSADHWPEQSRTDKDQSHRSKFKDIGNKEYFLVVSRLEPYKRVDLVVKTFNELSGGRSSHRYNLVIVGEGSQKKQLMAMAEKNIHFFKKTTDRELAWFYNHAQALIMPQEEDFGYVSLEAQFFGCPVIAYKKGGATETVVDRQTGIFFEEQSARSLQSALERFEQISYNLRYATKKFGIKNTERFSKKIFVKKFRNILSSKN